MNLFFDLDGTLIDAKPRLYKLFQHLVPGSKLTFNSYWELKSNQINHEEILNKYFSLSNQEINKFQVAWMKMIEEEEWLKYDKPFEGVLEFLIELKSYDHQINLVTARQNEDQVFHQLDLFDWDGLFDKVLVTAQKTEKEQLIKPFVGDDPFNNWMIGDTGKDIQVGKKLGIKSAAVLSGFLSESALKKYKPDVIIENVTKLKF